MAVEISGKNFFSEIFVQAKGIRGFLFRLPPPIYTFPHTKKIQGSSKTKRGIFRNLTFFQTLTSKKTGGILISKLQILKKPNMTKGVTITIEDRKNELIDRMEWKEVRFCHEYLLDQNPFEAAKRAGWGEEQAHDESTRLMDDPNAIFLIHSLAGAQGIKLEMDQEDDVEEERDVDKNFIISRLARIADFNSQTIKEEFFTKSGDVISKVKMRDPSAAIKALELLGKTKAMFIEKKEVEVGKDMAELIREARERAGIMQAPKIINGEVQDDE